MLSVTHDREAERWGGENSFNFSGRELRSLPDNPVWFYLVRLLVMWYFKPVL